MDIFSVLGLIGGLALFLFGMNTMGDGLEKLSGGRLESMLEKMTSNTIKGFALGVGVTAIIQSSSATTVMVVGFVNSGIMRLSQAIGIIMGANVGTTVTAWLLSLTGVEGDSIVMKMMQPINFSPILAMIGIALIMFAKNGKKKDAGNILVGFAILMFGMNMMSTAVKPLAEVPEFTSILTMFSNPIFGILAGALLTAVIQSSSASVGILQALSVTGAISFSTAIPIVMGQNIGTCVTAMISCIGAKKNAKRAAFVHLYFNIIGTVVILALFYGINAFVDFKFLNDIVNPADIAIIHTVFNISATALLLPFSKLLEKLACLTVRDKGTEDDTPFIDERFLNTPAVATAQCKSMTVKMAELSKKTILQAFSMIGNYNEKTAEKIMENEDKLDRYEDVLGTYLVKLCSKSLTPKDSAEVSKMLHDIGDFERIGDHAVNVLDVAKEMNEKKVRFSPKAIEELVVLNDALTEILTNSVEAFEQDNYVLAEHIEPLEQVIDNLTDELKLRHIKRLQDGECTIELGFMYSDLLTNYERVSDHCSNIAVCMIELSRESFGTHEYLHEIKDMGQRDFVESYKEYKVKYVLPETVNA
ncbi:MAG TPA: Na/Pi cotransporter family protein [Clostridiales bacterium]|nr:Na/Pi cotransporter family protein [Clostridiales bacterium]